MALTEQQHLTIRQFFAQSYFDTEGGVITDLDGTAIHEYAGAFTIPKAVETGLKKIYDLGRPVVINTLRFPLSVMRTFGQDWYRISGRPIPTVLMNGSQLGFVQLDTDGKMVYEELAAFPLMSNEIDAVIQNIMAMTANGHDELLLFYYPRNWRKGEIIWTPRENRVAATAQKYRSAEKVYSCPPGELLQHLLNEDICMIFLLLNLSDEKLMAYQHTERSNFYTHAGISKESGAQAIAALLQFSLPHSVGAGDSRMDTFLKQTGLSIHVGPVPPPYPGLHATMQVSGSTEMGELLAELATLQRAAS